MNPNPSYAKEMNNIATQAQFKIRSDKVKRTEDNIEGILEEIKKLAEKGETSKMYEVDAKNIDIELLAKILEQNFGFGTNTSEINSKNDNMYQLNIYWGI